MTTAHVTQQPMYCTKCENVWPEDMLQSVRIDVWLTHVKGIRCPRCGADSGSLMFIGNLEKFRATQRIAEEWVHESAD